jgi:putative transposase
MLLTYQYLISATKAQHRQLDALLTEQRALYNAALQERIECYRHTEQTRSFYDQCKSLTEWRHIDAAAAALPVMLQRWTLKRVDDAYRAFFRRVKAKAGKAGFPRYKSIDRWHSFGFHQWSGIRIKGSKLYLAGVTRGLRVNWHRPLPKDAAIKSCVFTKQDFGWTISLQVQLPDVAPRMIGSAIGIDMGINALVILSDGSKIPNQCTTNEYAVKLRVAQRALARKRRGSKRRKKTRLEVTRLHRQIRNSRNTHLHQVSRHLVNSYDLIAIEDLKVKGLAQGHLAKSVHDVAWGKLRQQLSYKAAGAGSHVVAVDAKYTSQLCSGCGCLVKKDLSERVHMCSDCGLVLDRDVNAARNILCRAVVRPEVGNVIPLGMSVGLETSI